MYFAFLDFLGTSELLVILFAALILFGPRRLPQLSRQLGRSLAEFKRASEDFKRTWEREVEMERLEEEGRIARAMLQDDVSATSDNAERMRAVESAAHRSPADSAETSQPTILRSASDLKATPPQPPAPSAETTTSEPSRKRDWL